jgi:hypothetical protein
MSPKVDAGKQTKALIKGKISEQAIVSIAGAVGHLINNDNGAAIVEHANYYLIEPSEFTDQDCILIVKNSQI